MYNLYLSGESSAVDQLMLRYGDALTVYLCAYLHNAQDAEDLMIEAFARIMVKKPSIKEGNFKAYLYKTARNLAARFAEKQRRSQIFILSAQQEDIPDPVITENLLLNDEKKEILYHCLRKIGSEYREVLWLIYMENLSYAQAAEVLGVNKKKIDNLLTRGKLSLRRELEKEGVTGAYE